MSTAIDTRLIDVVSWAAQMTTLLAPYGTVPVLRSPDDWRWWAAVVVALPAIAALGAPRPEPFPTWQDWARQFNPIARLLPT